MIDLPRGVPAAHDHLVDLLDARHARAEARAASRPSAARPGWPRSRRLAGSAASGPPTTTSKSMRAASRQRKVPVGLVVLLHEVVGVAARCRSCPAVRPALARDLARDVPGRHVLVGRGALRAVERVRVVVAARGEHGPAGRELGLERRDLALEEHARARGLAAPASRISTSAPISSGLESTCSSPGSRDPEHERVGQHQVVVDAHLEQPLGQRRVERAPVDLAPRRRRSSRCPPACSGSSGSAPRGAGAAGRRCRWPRRSRASASGRRRRRRRSTAGCRRRARRASARPSARRSSGSGARPWAFSTCTSASLACARIGRAVRAEERVLDAELLGDRPEGHGRAPAERDHRRAAAVLAPCPSRASVDLHQLEETVGHGANVCARRPRRRRRGGRG